MCGSVYPTYATTDALAWPAAADGCRGTMRRGSRPAHGSAGLSTLVSCRKAPREGLVTHVLGSKGWKGGRGECNDFTACAPRPRARARLPCSASFTPWKRQVTNRGAARCAAKPKHTRICRYDLSTTVRGAAPPPHSFNEFKSKQGFVHTHTQRHTKAKCFKLAPFKMACQELGDGFWL